MKKIIPIITAVLLCAGFLLYSKVTFHNRQGREGLFLLKGQDGDWLTLTDDLYPFESPRLIWSIAFPELKRATASADCTPTDKPCTSFEWNETSGRGFFKTYYPNGTRLITAFGRYISNNGRPVSGLFIGGGLPVSDKDYQASNNNEAGMTYFDGERYFHIWCNVNEGILDDAGHPLLPNDWEFISSKIIENSAQNLTILSRHRAMVRNVPVSIDRVMSYVTGDTFVTYHTTLKNIGTTSTSLMYTYGDEPWIGNFDFFSKGDVGWHKDGIVTTETNIDTAKHSYVGMFDYGNPLAGESHSFTGKANFLEWEPKQRPDTAYFSNKFGAVAPPERKVPLDSYKTRVVSLQWGPMALNSGQSYTFSLKVGMANNDPKSGFPVKPDTVHRK